MNRRSTQTMSAFFVPEGIVKKRKSIENDSPVLAECYKKTHQAVLALQFWQTSLDSWRHMKKVPPELFEATYALLRDAGLEEWAFKNDLEALWAAVVERQE